jgi:hypothetical protein
MRRLPLAWVLSLLLVFAQHGAVLHALGHLGHADHINGATLSADAHLLHSSLCPTCESFAQIANPAAAAAPPATVCAAAFLPVPDPCYTIVDANTPTPRSRGPPQA